MSDQHYEAAHQEIGKAVQTHDQQTFLEHLIRILEEQNKLAAETSSSFISLMDDIDEILMSKFPFCETYELETSKTSPEESPAQRCKADEIDYLITTLSRLIFNINTSVSRLELIKKNIIKI